MLRRRAIQYAGLFVMLAFAASHLTEEDKVTIVDLHNHFRSRVKPSAAYMQKMEWDELLRVVAEGYAAKCIWDHNPELTQMGENLFVMTGAFDPSLAMTSWFNEHVDYDFENNTCTEGKMCGHYTQVVWADVKAVGCASHFCESVEGLDFEESTLLVCNYLPGGNYEGERPYQQGPSCTMCPEDLPVCVDNLCVPEAVTESSEGPAIVEDSMTLSPPMKWAPEPTEAPNTVGAPSTAQVPGADPTELHAEDKGSGAPTSAPPTWPETERRRKVDVHESGSSLVAVSVPLLLLTRLLSNILF